MPARRQSGKRGIDLNEKRTNMTLLRVELSGEVADVRGFNFLRLDTCCLERAQSRLAHHSHEMLAFFRPVTGKVGLRSAQYIHRRWLGHHAFLLSINVSDPLSNKSPPVLEHAAGKHLSTA